MTKPIRTADLFPAIERAVNHEVDPQDSTSHEEPSGSSYSEDVLDLTAALRRVAGDRKLLEDLVGLFVENCPADMEEMRQAVTASCGVATSDYQHPLAPDAMLRLADEALYRAKARGRNCSESAVAPEISISDAFAGQSEQNR